MTIDATTEKETAKSAADLYLDLMKKCLTFSLWDGRDGAFNQAPASFGLRSTLKKLIKGTARGRADAENKLQGRLEGRDWPLLGHTMIGMKRLDNLQFCVERALADGVPGDLIETGVWRGGATIFMRAILKAHGVTDRCVWVADSFEGLPPPNPEKYPADAGDIHHLLEPLAIPLEQVKLNFEHYDLLDDQVRFLKGWFKETLPKAPIERLAVMRLDGDMYESTMDALTSLYDRLSVGGYAVIDDFGAVPGCRRAIEDFRNSRRITAKIHEIDWSGIYWRRE
jgi:O-methyltransferase